MATSMKPVFGGKREQPFTDAALKKIALGNHGGKTWLIRKLVAMIDGERCRKVLVAVEGQQVTVYGSQGVEVEVLKVEAGEDVREVLAARAGAVAEVRWSGLPAISLEECRTSRDWKYLAIQAVLKMSQAQIEEEMTRNANRGRT